jgi:hypothetical protein
MPIVSFSIDEDANGNSIVRTATWFIGNERRPDVDCANVASAALQPSDSSSPLMVSLSLAIEPSEKMIFPGPINIMLVAVVKDK